jgi:hypothetical protein
MSVENNRFTGVTNNGKKNEEGGSFLEKLARTYQSDSAPTPSGLHGETLATAAQLQVLKGEGRVSTTDASAAQIAQVMKGTGISRAAEGSMHDVYTYFLAQDEVVTEE